MMPLLRWTALLEGNADEFTVIANQVSFDPQICNQVHYQGRPVFIITVIYFLSRDTEPV